MAKNNVSNNDACRPALAGWLGGKSKMAKQIINYMPEHTCYVEPFACCVGSFL